MPNLQPNKMIYRLCGDNSVKTKKITYYGELIDFSQFTLMTGLSDVLNAFLDKKGKEIPVFGLNGVDVASYALMVYLAALREGKFAQRYGQFNEQNSEAYYQEVSAALLDALEEDEKAELRRDTRGGLSEDRFIVELLKYNATLISPDNLPAARTTLDKWRIIFEKAKHRPSFIAARYQARFRTLYTEGHFSEETLHKKVEAYFTNLKKDRIEEIELGYIQLVLSHYSTLNIQERDAKYFYAKLKALELLHDDDDIQEKHNQLLEEYGIPLVSAFPARHALMLFYDIYHAQQDQNDKAFYKANLRGIQEDELFRTHFKTHLFRQVKQASVVGLAYSLITLGISVTREILKKDPLPLVYLIAPLFLVGATSLIDEMSDLYFKNKKYWESKEDLAQWKTANANVIPLFTHLLDPNSPQIKRFCEHDENRQAIWSYYLASREPNEAFDVQRFGEKYLKAKYQEHKDLEDRLTRRWTKLTQAACSFTGVFFGVLISWAISILAVAFHLEGLETKLGFAGFGTIGMAGLAGVIMVGYQSNQNGKKVEQAEEAEQEELTVLDSECPGYWNYRPQPSL